MAGNGHPTFSPTFPLPPSLSPPQSTVFSKLQKNFVNDRRSSARYVYKQLPPPPPVPSILPGTPSFCNFLSRLLIPSPTHYSLYFAEGFVFFLPVFPRRAVESCDRASTILNSSAPAKLYASTLSLSLYLFPLSLSDSPPNGKRPGR